MAGARAAGCARAAGAKAPLACRPARAANSAAPARAGAPGAPGAGAGALRQQLRQDGSRHRYRHAPPDTPPGFWKVGFPGDSLVRSGLPPGPARAAAGHAGSFSSTPRHAAWRGLVGCLNAWLVPSAHRGFVTAAARRMDMLPGVMCTVLRAPG